jgi:hypothetical protein
MTTAALVTLAEDVVTQLNAKQGGWSKSFKAERFYTPSPKLEETGTVRCLVVPADCRISPDNRTDWEHEYDVDIGLLYRPSPEKGEQPLAAFDAMLLLVQQVCDYWLETRATNANCPLNPQSPISFPNGIYIQEHIQTLNQFTSVIRLTFWKLRDPDA